MNFKVLHIVSALDASSGGPTRSISGLCKALAQGGVDTNLFVHSLNNAKLSLGSVKLLTGSGSKLRAWQESKNVISEVQPDIIHLHGLWMPFNHFVMMHAKKLSLPVVLSVRGMLDPWALQQKALKKRLALFLYQRCDLRSVTCFHATASQEKRNIRNQGFKQPVCVIPNGVDIPKIKSRPIRNNQKKKVALFLSRLHPGKGLLDLVTAWSIVKPVGWRMRIVGPDVCGHQTTIEAEIRRLGLQDDFEFVGELDDDAKWDAYADADLFVHPSHSENFGISIAEALSAELPVITTKGTPWAELLGKCENTKARECENFEARLTNKLTNSRTNELARTGRSGWWIDVGIEPLGQALQEAIRLNDDERLQMGQNGRKLVGQTYAWDSIAAEMKSAYEWILHGGEKPECVVLD